MGCWGLLGVAGGCWDDEITNVMTWIIPENSLPSLRTSKMMFATFAHAESPYRTTLDAT